MTREEAIEKLKTLNYFNILHKAEPTVIEALNIAIESLSADVVSRDEYIKLLEESIWKSEHIGKLLKYQTEVAEPKWIPVSERLPKVGEQVLCCDSQSRVFTSALTEIASNGMTFFGQHCKVLAWMPLPKPYGESEVEE